MQNYKNQVEDTNTQGQSAAQASIDLARAKTITEVNEKNNTLAVFEHFEGGEINLLYVSLIDALNDKYEIVPANCLEGQIQTFRTLDGHPEIASKENIKKYFSRLAEQAFFEQVQHNFELLLKKADASWQDANNFCEQIFKDLVSTPADYLEIDKETGKKIDIATRYAQAFSILQNRFVELAVKFRDIKKELWQAKRERAWAEDYIFASNELAKDQEHSPVEEAA